MAINYTWKITAMKKAPSMDGLSDVVTHLNFDYTGKKGEIEATFHGACPVGPPDSENFTALADLTEADVIEWAKANHPVEHMQEVIEGQIADQETPKNVEVGALPWISE
tara:strand:- start:251 stop:577 length:327 start_codon:yes stop_codon:yes gene_type:complete